VRKGKEDASAAGINRSRASQSEEKVHKELLEKKTLEREGKSRPDRSRYGAQDRNRKREEPERSRGSGRTPVKKEREVQIAL